MKKKEIIAKRTNPLIYSKDKEFGGYRIFPFEGYSFAKHGTIIWQGEDSTLLTFALIFKEGDVKFIKSSLEKYGNASGELLYTRSDGEYIIIGDQYHIRELWVKLKKEELLQFLGIWIQLTERNAEKILIGRENNKFTISGNELNYSAEFEIVEAEHRGGSCCDEDDPIDYI